MCVCNANEKGRKERKRKKEKKETGQWWWCWWCCGLHVFGVLREGTEWEQRAVIKANERRCVCVCLDGRGKGRKGQWEGKRE